MDDQRRQQPGGPFGVELDQLQPGPDVLQVGAVGLDLPVVADPGDPRGLKPQLDQGIDKDIDQIAFLGLGNPLAHVEHAVEGGPGKFAGPGFQDREGFLNQIAEIAVGFVGDEPRNGPVDFAQGLLVNHGETRHIHDMKQKQKFTVAATAARGAGPQQLLGDFTVDFDKGFVGRQGQQAVEHRAGFGRRLGEGLVQRFFKLFQAVVRNLTENSGQKCTVLDLVGFVLKPLLGVIHVEEIGESVAVVAGQEPVQVAAVRLRGAVCGAKGPGDFGQLVVAHGDQGEVLLGQRRQPPAGIRDDRQEFSEPGPGVGDDLVKEEQQVVDGVGLDFPIAAGGDGLQENLDVQPGGVLALVVAVDQVKVVQGVNPGLADDELPVLVRVGELFQEDVDPVHQAEVFGHDGLQRRVARVDLDLHVVAGQIDFQGLGLNFHEPVFFGLRQPAGCAALRWNVFQRDSAIIR